MVVWSAYMKCSPGQNMPCYRDSTAAVRMIVVWYLIEGRQPSKTQMGLRETETDYIRYVGR
jgi:hypothetical protein